MGKVALPLTYPDLVCLDDLDPFAQETTSDLETLVQDMHHLLVQLPGSNPDLPDSGVGVQMYLSGTSQNLQGLSAKIVEQFTRDNRIDTCTADIAQQANGMWLLAVSIGVDGNTIPLEYGWQNGNLTYLSGAL